MRVERRGAVDRVDDGDDAVEPVAQHQIGVIHDRVQHRRGIGEARRLDDDAAERRHPRIVAPLQEILERRDEIAPDRAAQAPRGEQDHIRVDLLDEQMIEADLAELVDQHHRVAQALVAQQAVEQRRLARAQKSGEHAERHRRRRAAQMPRRLPRAHAAALARGAPNVRLRMMAPSTSAPPAY